VYSWLRPVKGVLSTRILEMLTNNLLLKSCRTASRSHTSLKAATPKGSNVSSKFAYGSRLSIMRLNTQQSEQSTIYVGPLATVAKRLKIFSISSLGLSGAISPFVFIIDVPVPVFAKAALVGSGIHILNCQCKFFSSACLLLTIS